MFCEKCGSVMKNNKCTICTFEKFENSTPVGVALVPVRMPNGEMKLLGVKRGIIPKRGELALPGGFQEIEDITDCVAREVLEETGVSVTVKNNDCLALSTPDGRRTLLFFVTEQIDLKDVNLDFKNVETMEVVLLDEKTELAFPLHKEAVKWFFESAAQPGNPIRN